MIVQTTRFGKIKVAEDEIITMHNGPLGFSNARLFTLRDDEISSPFRWFQSLENESLAFVTVDPQLVVSGYQISISEDHIKKLQADNLDQLSVMVIVTMTKDIKDVTVNLQGPLVINQGNRMGLQLVIPDGQYSTRHLLFGDKLGYEHKEGHRETEEREAVAAVG